MSDAQQEIPESTVVVCGRLSYCDAFKPKPFGKGEDATGEPKYKTNILVPKEETVVGGVTMGGKKALAVVKKAIAAAKKEKWGADESSHPKLPMSKVCLRDGDNPEYGDENSAGHWIVVASELEAPQVIDRDGVTPLTEADGKIYSGAWARVVINAWGMDNKWGKRVNANLRAIGFIKHDEKFGKGRVNAASMFGSLDDDDDSGFDPEVDEDDEEMAF